MLTTTLERRRMQAIPNGRIGNGVTTRIQVLVVEDEPAISGFIRRGLALEGFDVRVVDDGNEAVQVLRDQPPDLVVLDVMLPGLDGIEIARRLRNAEAAAGVTGIPVIMLTARDAITDRVLGLEAGADDYLVKPFAFDELLARIRALLRRTRPNTTDDALAILSFGDLEVDLLARTAQRGERSLRFTTREFDLLVLFLRHPNQVLSRRQIMSRIWGNDFYGDSNVLEVFIGSLRRELEVDGRARLIQTIRGAGYVLREQA